MSGHSPTGHLLELERAFKLDQLYKARSGGSNGGEGEGEGGDGSDAGTDAGIDTGNDSGEPTTSE